MKNRITTNAGFRRTKLVLLACLASRTSPMTMSVKTSRALSSSRIVKGLLDRVKHNDRAGDAVSGAMRFVLGGSGSNPTSVGLVLPQAANEFSRFPSLFSVTDKEVRLLDRSDWLDEETSDNKSLLLSKRSEALQKVLQTMREADSIPALRGWRGETFSVRESFHADPLLYVERAAAVLFGVPTYGVFVNGYCCDANDKPTHLWIGKRSSTKQTWPSRWDSLAAGGLGAGMMPRQAMLNECIEEAGIDESYLKENLKAVSAVSYTGFNDDGWGLKRDVLFCFDLQVPDDFVPVPVDGEMESFEKLSVDTVVELLAEPIRQEDDSDNLWKPNVGVVLIDFFVRHGILDADDPHFLELIDALRGSKCA